MPRLFFGNFDFEHELANPAGWRAPQSVRQLLAERASAWISIADDGDVIWTPKPIADSFWEELSAAGLPRVRGLVSASASEEVVSQYELVPWGWSETVAEQFSDISRERLQAVSIGNSRRWSFDLEQQLGAALPGAASLERLDDFVSVVAIAASQLGESVDELAWVIKANFGMAARERVLGRGIVLSETHQRWLQSRITLDGAVYFEPWMKLRAEVGIQWSVPKVKHGTPKLEGLTPLITDSRGQYRGSRISLDDSIPTKWEKAVELTLLAAERLQSLGYVGPLGIDAVIAEDSQGRAILRPLQDVNARFTMGRLALGFRRLLQLNEFAEWQHGESNADANAKTRTIVTSPAVVGGTLAKHQSQLLITTQACGADESQ